MTIDRLN